MKKIIAYFVIILSSLILIIEIINDFSVLKTGYTIAFCKDGFIKDTLLVNEFGSASGTSRNSTSNFSSIYHGTLVSNKKKASIELRNDFNPFLKNFKDHRILVYHSKYTAVNLFYWKPTNFSGLDIKYLIEPFLFLFSTFSILYLLLRKYSKK